MSISKINNSIYFSNSQNNTKSKNLRSFQGRQFSEDETIEKLSDDDMQILASAAPDRRLHHVAKNTVKTLLVTIPLFDTIASGVVKGGNLSDKLLKSASTAGKWGAVFATALALGGIKSYVNSKSETLDNLNKKHALVSTAIDFTVLYTAFTGLLNGAQKLAVYTKNSFPKIIDGFNKSLAMPVKNLLNNSFINKKLVKPAENYVSKRPHLAAANKLTASLLVPAMAIAVLLRFNKEAKNRDENVKNNYMFLNEINNLIPDKD